MKVEELGHELISVRGDLTRKLGQLELVQTQNAQAEASIVSLGKQEQVLRATSEVLRRLTELQRRSVVERLEHLVSRGLQIVFENESYIFKIASRSLRNEVSFSFLLSREGVETDIFDATGGGVIDIVSILLRIFVLFYFRSDVRRLLVLDEPFKHLSAEYQDGVAKLLEHLSEQTGIQMIIVSHRDGITPKGAREFTLSKHGNSSSIRETGS